MKFSKIISYVRNIEGWLSVHEAYFLYQIAKNGPKKGEIVEIGSWKGKSTICLAAGSKQANRGKVTAIDPHKGVRAKKRKKQKLKPTYREFLHNIKNTGVEDWILPFVQTSKAVAHSWKKKIRLLFIDGLHDYGSTYQDFKLWQLHVKQGGIIAFHDAFCGHDGPERVVLEEILTNPSFSGFGVIGSIIYARKKKAISLLEKFDRIRHCFFIPLSVKFNKLPIQKTIKFIIIHRLFKLFLINKYTYETQIHSIK